MSKPACNETHLLAALAGLAGAAVGFWMAKHCCGKKGSCCGPKGSCCGPKGSCCGPKGSCCGEKASCCGEKASCCDEKGACCGDNSGLKKITAPNSPPAIAPYSQAIAAGDTLYVSGCIGIDAKTNQLASDEIKGQTQQVLENLKAVLTAGGSSLDKVVKTTVLLSDMKDYAIVNEIYATYFPANGTPPARACYAVAGLPRNALVEIECIAKI